MIIYGLVERVRVHRRYFDELRRHAQDVVSRQEQELSRLTLDLHDGLAPLLAAIRLQVRKVNRSLQNEKLGEAEDRLRQAIEDLRSILHNLTPRHLQAKGLPVVLDEFFTQCKSLYPVAVDFRYEIQKAVPERIAVHLYRLVQEAVQNALRHSEADQVVVAFHETKRSLYILCSDNGRGFVPSDGDGYGLHHLRLRTVLLNGDLQCDSVPGKGTTYFFTIPKTTVYETH